MRHILYPDLVTKQKPKAMYIVQRRKLPLTLPGWLRLGAYLA